MKSQGQNVHTRRNLWYSMNESFFGIYLKNLILVILVILNATKALPFVIIIQTFQSVRKTHVDHTVHVWSWRSEVPYVYVSLGILEQIAKLILMNVRPNHAAMEEHVLTWLMDSLVNVLLLSLEKDVVLVCWLNKCKTISLGCKWQENPMSCPERNYYMYIVFYYSIHHNMGIKFTPQAFYFKHSN